MVKRKKEIAAQKRPNFTSEQRAILMRWFLELVDENEKFVYLTREERIRIMDETGLTTEQVDQDFINKRRRVDIPKTRRELGITQTLSAAEVADPGRSKSRPNQGHDDESVALETENQDKDQHFSPQAEGKTGAKLPRHQNNKAKKAEKTKAKIRKTEKCHLKTKKSAAQHKAQRKLQQIYGLKRQELKHLCGCSFDDYGKTYGLPDKDRNLHVLADIALKMGYCDIEAAEKNAMDIQDVEDQKGTVKEASPRSLHILDEGIAAYENDTDVVEENLNVVEKVIKKERADHCVASDHHTAEPLQENNSEAEALDFMEASQDEATKPVEESKGAETAGQIEMFHNGISSELAAHFITEHSNEKAADTNEAIEDLIDGIGSLNKQEEAAGHQDLLQDHNAKAETDAQTKIEENEVVMQGQNAGSREESKVMPAPDQPEVHQVNAGSSEIVNEAPAPSPVVHLVLVQPDNTYMYRAVCAHVRNNSSH